MAGTRLDCDPHVTAFASQPFWLHWAAELISATRFGDAPIEHLAAEQA
ncbi:hypothetical protein [Micromonospora sp. NPDC003776]